MLRLGITGNIGSGKSYLCDLFKKKGIPVFHSDDETKSLYYLPSIKKIIVNRFGDLSYLADGSLNKPYIGQQIFNDEENMKFVESVLYPALFQCFDEWCSMQHAPFVLFESAILYEKHLTGRFDGIIFISAPEDIRIQRVMNRDKCSEESVRTRMKLQWNDEKKSSLADYVIIHDGNDNPEDEVQKVYDTILKKISHS